MSKKYSTHSSRLKFKVALEALKGNKTVVELCQEYGLSSSQIYDWKKKLEEAGPNVFSGKMKSEKNDAEIDRLHATIGKLKVECDFLSKALNR